MSIKSSPSSVADPILQGKGKATDCEIEFMLLMKAKNNEITAKLPTMAGVLLGKNPTTLPDIPAITDPDDFIQKTHIAGLITQRVKDLAEREKATTTVKAMVLGWFHHSLEDYLQSEADIARATDWASNDWPKIVSHVKGWFLEQVTQNVSLVGTTTSIAEKEAIMREYREMYMLANQSVNEFETKFKCMIKIVNDKDRADARKGEEEQAKDFVDKLHGTTFGYWKAEVKADEDRQQQRMSCQQQREPIKGYPQTLSEAVNRAKVVERQVAERIKRQQGKGNYTKTVSYTHLTLPTIYSV